MTARRKGLLPAATRTVAALRKQGELEDVDALLVENVLFTAGLLDTLEPGTSPAQVASLTRAHLAAVRMLLGRDTTPGERDELTQLLADIAFGPPDTVESLH
jgi:hypothetical protein